MSRFEPQQGEFVIREFRFRSGEILPELRLHYTTVGTPRRDARGMIENAVLFLHHTGSSGSEYLGATFAKEIFGARQPLDPARWYTILPDAIGHGQSSKPSDSLHMRFPHYDYADMVEAQHRLLTEGLGVQHVKLVTGVSMGGMHTWLWGEEYPDFMDTLMPMVSLPVEIAGRNRMWRTTAKDAIRKDPAWNNGEYGAPPAGLLHAARIFAIAVNGPIDLQHRGPNAAAADRLLDELAARKAGSDANDFLYALDASRTYNPQPRLGRIKAPLLAINATDDFINPIDVGVLDREIKRVKLGRALLLKSTGMGHHTVHDPRVWKKYLARMLATRARP